MKIKNTTFLTTLLLSAFLILPLIHSDDLKASQFIKMCESSNSPKEIKKTIGYLKIMVQKTFSVKNTTVKSEYHLAYEFPRYEFSKKELYDYNKVESFLIRGFNDKSISCSKVKARLDKLTSMEMATVPPNKIAMDRLDRKTWTIKGITDISPLAEFTKLKYLHLGQNSIRSLEPLKNMNNLIVLKIGKNDIEDVSPLKNLNNLRVLEIFENMIEDISPLKSLKKLEYLSLFSNFIGERIKHSKMTKKQRRNQQIKNLETINSLSNLKYLGASGNGFTTIDELKDGRNLLYLNLSNNLIEKIDNLTKMRRLKYLVLKKNKIIDIDSLRNLTNLVSLKLSGDKNLIKCWAPLAPLGKITKTAYFSINHKIGGEANKKIDGLSKGEEYTCIKCGKKGSIRSPLIRRHCRGLGKYSQYFCEERPFSFCIQRNCNSFCNKLPRNKKGKCRKDCRTNVKGSVFKKCKTSFKKSCR